MAPSGVRAQSPLPLTDIPQQYVIPPTPTPASPPIMVAMPSGTPVGTSMSFVKPAAAVVLQNPKFDAKKQDPLREPNKVPSEKVADEDAVTKYQVRLNMPGPETLYRLESETQLQERLRQEFRQVNDPSADVDFPDQKLVLSKAAFAARALPQQAIYAEPSYLVHHRLYFEQKNFDRYGWELGFLQPFVSAAIFYKDLAFLPYHIGEDVHRRYEVSVGNCLPGDPVPLTLIPPHISLSGGLLQTLTTVGIAAAFP